MSACTHRIRLEEPAGTFAIGRCTLCGLERQYSNVFPDDLPERGAWKVRNAIERAQGIGRGRYASVGDS